MRETIGQQKYNLIINSLLDANMSLRYTLGAHDLPFSGTFFQYRTSVLNWCPIGRNATLEDRKQWIEYDKKFNLIGYSQPFKFMDGRIEFCCGMAMHPDGNDVYITFGFQDNTAYLVQVPGSYLEENLSLPEE